MNKDTIQANFLNGQTLNDVSPLMLWGIIGFILSVLIDILRNKEKIKRTGGFNLSYWLKDNIVRLLISIIAIFIGCIFTEDLFNIKGNLGGLMAGFMTDKVVEALVKFRSNIDITKFLTKEK